LGPVVDIAAHDPPPALDPGFLLLLGKLELADPARNDGRRAVAEVGKGVDLLRGLHRQPLCGRRGAAQGSAERAAYGAPRAARSWPQPARRWAARPGARSVACVQRATVAIEEAFR